MIITNVTDIFNAYGDFERAFGDIRKKGNTITYKNSEIMLESKEIKHKSGIIERCDKIKNVSKREIEITTLLSKFTLNGGEYEVYTHTNQHIEEGQGGWSKLVTGIYGSSDDIRTNQDVCPYVAIFNEQSGRGYAFHIMNSSLFEYRVSKHGEYLYPRVVTVELGIRSDNFSYKLKPNETLELPKILYYQFKSKLDLDAYKLHRYFNEKRPHSLPIMYNTWMSHFDLIEFDTLVEQLERAKMIGCEYFTVDAGWFGETQKWWDVVGDWQESEKSSMKGRLKEFADLVREKGLRFGLWFEIERASAESENVKNHKEFYIWDKGHYYIDFANKDACDFIYGILKENIDKYGVEFIKFDLNGSLTFDKTRKSFIDFFKGYNYFTSRIRQDYPDLHLECCASGGGRMSASNAYSFDSFWMSDSHGIYTQLEIFKNAIKHMPSSMLERWATIRSVENFTPTYPVGGSCEKILLSTTANWQRAEEASIEYIKNGLVGGPVGVSCDLTQVSEKTLLELADFIKQYKSEREFWKNSECHILCDTPTLTVLQFNDISLDTVKIYVYAKHPKQEKVTIYPFMEKLSGKYELTFQNGDRVSKKATELNEEGITLDASYVYSTDSVTLKRI